MVLLDLRYVHGEINEFGDPQVGSNFGLDDLLPMMHGEFGGDLPIVVLSSTDKEQLNAAVRAAGALDFIQRTPGAGTTADRGRAALVRALSAHGLLADESNMIAGRSLPTMKMLRQARRGAMSARNILIHGESGTGKGLLARYIHLMSSRQQAPFETFHAAHRPADLQADELFGHWRGAFTGATEDSRGVWERADGGTVFIDEVADIDLGVQKALMQPIEERVVGRLGAHPKGEAQFRNIDVMVVLATNRDLGQAAATGTLKNDFLNRINAFDIEVPSLRDRREDIPSLVTRLTQIIEPRRQAAVLPDALEVLQARDWRDGNIRELRNILERAFANNPGQDITRADVLPTQGASIEDVDSRPSKGDTAAGNVLIDALQKSSTDMTLAEADQLRQQLAGAFPEMMAQTLALMLQLTKSGGRLNPTAAVRLLLGNQDMTTLQAKQFLKRVLTLETQTGAVSRAFERTGLADQHEMLQRIIKSCAPGRGGSAAPGSSGGGRSGKDERP
jgi:DNA-binding NtrC family response regulator